MLGGGISTLLFFGTLVVVNSLLTTFTLTQMYLLDSLLPSTNSIKTALGTSTIDCGKKCVSLEQCKTITVHQGVCSLYSTSNFTSSVSTAAVGARTFILDTKEYPYIDGYKCVLNLNLCYKFYETKLNWTNARDACLNEGAHLVVVNSAIKQKIISKDVSQKATQRYYTGMNDLEVEGQFKDIHGNILTFTNWDTKAVQPNNVNNQDCITFHAPLRGWYDDNCEVLSGYICEK